MATDVSIKLGVSGEDDLRTALKAVESQLRNLDSEMKATVSSLTGMDDAEGKTAKQTDILGRSITAAKQKVGILSKQYDEARGRLDELGSELDEAKRAFGENSAEALKAESAYNRQAKVVNDLGTKLNKATADLDRMEGELKDVRDAADHADDALDDLGDGVGGLKGALSGLKAGPLGAVAGAVSGFVQSAISGIRGLIDETTEYQRIMGVLETSSKKAGYSADQTAQSYRQLYQVIGEDQASATALANLQALGLGQADLTRLIDGAIGAWATYGDSIPIDSLSEAINETIQAGQVTGTFADVLNWAGTSEDGFNEALAAAEGPAERAKLVLDELSRQGLPELADAFREANPEIVAMNDANARMQDSLADIGKALTPVVATVTGGMASLLKALAPVGQAFGSVFQGAVELLRPVAEGLSQQMDRIRAAIDRAFTPEQQAAIASFFQTLGSVLLSVPFGVLSAGLNLVLQGVELLVQGVGVLVDFFGTTVPAAFQTAVRGGKDFVTTLGAAFGQLVRELGAALSQALSAVVQWVGSMIAKAREMGQGVLTAVGDFFGQLPSRIAGLLSAALTALVSWAADMAAKAGAGMAKVKIAVVNGLKAIPSQVVSVGRDIVRGLWNGISNAAGWLLGKIRGWCGSILDGIKGFFGIASPSRVMRDQVGLMIARGLAVGIQKGERQVLAVADALNAKLLAKEEALTKQLEDTGLDEATKTALTSQLDLVKQFRSEYESALADIQKAEDGMAKKLKDYGDLFETVKTETGSFLELSDLEEQIRGIERYGAALDALKARGVSDSLMDEVLGLSVDDATAYTEKLLAMTDDQYGAYMALWQQKQTESQAIAKQFYQDEMDALGKEFVDKIPDELSDVKDEMRSIGVQGIQGMIDGMYSRSGALYAAARSIVSSAIAAMQMAADIHSPSKKTRDLIGKPLAQGVAVGFLSTMARVSRDMAAVMLDPIPRLTREDLYGAAAGVVNGNAGLAMAGAGGMQTVVIPVILNGKQIAEVVYDPLKDVKRQRGQ